MVSQRVMNASKGDRAAVRSAGWGPEVCRCKGGLPEVTSELRLEGGEGGSPTDTWGTDTPGRYPGRHSSLCAPLTLPFFLPRPIRGSPQNVPLDPL